MFVILSPAKKLDFSNSRSSPPATSPVFPQETSRLVRLAQQFSRKDLGQLMGISKDLADLNYKRFQAFDLKGSGITSKQAVLAFNGDVYVGLDAETLDAEDLAFAQKHVGILSGLYGLLRPLDKIQPYRLEMGTSVSTQRGEKLHDYWKAVLTNRLNEIASGMDSKFIINLASNEYFCAVDTKKLKSPVIQPTFKEVQNGVPRIISFFAKKARGMMARHIIKRRLTTPEGIKSFSMDGYDFSPKLSTETNWVFLRNKK